MKPDMQVLRRPELLVRGKANTSCSSWERYSNTGEVFEQNKSDKYPVYTSSLVTSDPFNSKYERFQNDMRQKTLKLSMAKIYDIKAKVHDPSSSHAITREMIDKTKQINERDYGRSLDIARRALMLTMRTK